MARPVPLIPLGYGKFVRADRAYALVPLEGGERGDGRRTLVHVEGIDEPLVASRSEGAIARALAEAFGQPLPRGRHEGVAGQEALFWEAPLRDCAERLLVSCQLVAKVTLELPVDLAHPALGDAEDLADLAQRQVVDVEQD